MNTHLSTLRRLLSFGACIYLSFFAANTRATNLFWDNNGTSTPSNGTWDTTSTKWATSSALTASTIAYGSGNFPEFVAGGTPLSSLTITVNSAVSCVGMATGLSGSIATNITFQGNGGSIAIVTNGGTFLNGGWVQGFFCGGSAGNFTYNVPLTGAGGIQQKGNGYIALYGTNTYSGGTALTGGQTIYFNNNNSFGSSGIYVGGSSGGIVNAASTMVTIPNNFTFPTANYNLNLAANTTAGTTYSGTFTLPSSGMTLLYTGGSPSGEVVIISGVISGTSGLTVADNGYMELSATNTFTGALSITSPAVVAITNAGLLGNGGSYSANITNSSQFIYASSATQTLGGVISGAGSLLDEGSGVLTLSGTANTYTGGTTINSSGVIQINADASLGATSSGLTLNGGCLKNNNTSPSLSSSRTITLGASGGYIDAGYAPSQLITVGSKLTGSGALLINMDGTPVILNNTANNYTGNTIIGTNGPGYYSSGTAAWLKLGASGVIPNGSGNGNVIIYSAWKGLLDLNGFNQTINGLLGDGTVTNTSATTATLTVGNNNASSTFAGIIKNGAGTVAVTKTGTGTQTFSGINTYTGATTINAGTLALGSTGSVSNSSSITLAAGGTLDVSAISAFDLSSSTSLTANGTATAATIHGASGGTVDLGSRPLTLSYDGTHPALTISQGTLSINGNSITVNGSALPVATYTIIQQSSGNVSASGTFSVSGTAVAGKVASISVSGGNVNLVVQETPSFSSLTTAPSVTYGATSVTLSGKLSATGPLYPASGETVTVTINGNAQNTTTSNSTGDFSINYNPSAFGVGSSPYTITYSYGGDSSLTAANNASTSLTVNPASLGITANNQSKTYGQTVSFGSGGTNFTATGLKNGETVGSVTLTSSGGAGNALVSGSPYTITPSAATGGTFNPANYSNSYFAGTLTIGPATLTVTAGSFSIAYGETNPVFTAEYTNFANGETLGTSDVHGAPALTTAATTNSDVGIYVITNSIGTLTSTNYTFSFVNGALTVTNALTTNVLTASTNPALPATAIVFTATLSAIAPSTAVPTNLVQFLLDGTNAAVSIYPSNGLAIYTNAALSHGYHTIEADYAGDTNAVGETNIIGSTNTLTELINTPPVAGSATYTRQFNSMFQIAVSSLLTNATDADGDAISLVSVSATSTNGGAVVVTNGNVVYTPPATNGNVTDAFTYTVEDAYGATDSGVVTMVVVQGISSFSSLSNHTNTYGSTSVSLSGTVSSGTNYPAMGEAVTATINGHSVVGNIGDSTGDFTLVFNDSSLATLGAGSYSVTYTYAGDSGLTGATNAATLYVVSPASLGITANNQTKTYGQTATFGSGSTNFTATGLVNGETVGSVTLVCSGGASNSSVASSPYAITPSAATGGTFNPANYSITYNSGTLTVGAATLTVTADNISAAYGETNLVFTAEYTNFVNGETLGNSDVHGAPVLTTAATANSDVGTYTITNSIGTLTSSNYAFSFVNGTLTVTNALSTNSLAASTTNALPGSNVVFTATLSTLAPSSAVPTNLVTFFDGTNDLGPAYPSNGVALYTNSTLSHGYHTILAGYSGDTNAAGATNIVGSSNTVMVLINTPPVAGTASYSRPPNTALHIAITGLLTNATDADGDTLTLLSVSATSTNGATITTNGSMVTYTPPSTNGNVADAFTYVVEDSYGATNAGSVDVTVFSESSAPSVNITGMTTLGNGTVQVNFAGIPNYVYLIEATTNLTQPITWTVLSTNTAGTNGLFQFTDSAATNYPTRYYRTAVPPGY